MFLGLLSIQHSLDQNLLRGTFKGFFFFSSALNQASGRTPSSIVETGGLQFTVIQLLHAISLVHRVAVALGGSDTDSFARSCT